MFNLKTIIALVKPMRIWGDENNVVISGVSQDSRECKQQHAFVVMPSFCGVVHEFDYVAHATSHGARVIISQQPCMDAEQDVTWLQVDNTPLALSQLSKLFFPEQPDHMVAVTGTSGKSSVVDFALQLFSHAGLSSASMGTTGVKDSSNRDYEGFNGMTTPDAIRLHCNLNALAENNVTHAAMEASSHALEQQRMDGVHVQAAAFTNLSHDHLDYHCNMSDYLQAKCRLFSSFLTAGKTAVINKDSPLANDVVQACCEGVDIILYGQDSHADLRFVSQKQNVEGSHVDIFFNQQVYQVFAPLVGGFQISNMVCAVGLVMATGVPIEKIMDAIPKLQSVPGRLQRIHSQVYVDYAHKPDALKSVLTALRPYTQKRLHVVFGCGGNRDHEKRSLMGGIAEELADEIYVTDDNPRNEDPAIIRAKIIESCPRARNIGNRAQAIQTAIHHLSAGDILVIAGKGHETYQLINGVKYDCDDAKIALEFLSDYKE